MEEERVVASISWRGLHCAIFKLVSPVANEAGWNGAGTRRNALSKRALAAEVRGLACRIRRTGTCCALAI